MEDFGLENGYVRIPNEIFEALSRARIPGQARQVLDFIIRKTWGYQKKKDRISLSQFTAGTGLIKTSIIKAREKLIQMNLISVTQKGNRRMPIYRFNGDFAAWKLLPKREILSKKEKSVTNKGDKTLPKRVHTKENNTKKRYMEHVLLTEGEFKKLKSFFGEKRARDWIEDLNNYIGKKGEAWINKNYRSHYFMIMCWSKEERRRIKTAAEAWKREEEERKKFLEDREKLNREMKEQEPKPAGEVVKNLREALEKKEASILAPHFEKKNMEISIETVRQCLQGGAGERAVSDILRGRGLSAEKIGRILTEAQGL